MSTVAIKKFPVEREEHLVEIRRQAREAATKAGLSIVAQTKLVTAASELGRNILRYACQGEVSIEIVSSAGRSGVKMIFTDSGPGIEDIDQAMRDGYTTGGGMGLGLGGTRRLVHEFDIKSAAGQGTQVTIICWK